MNAKTICVIAPLPPKGNVAARHAGQVIYYLDKAGFEVRPSTAQGPAYSLNSLKFAPKRAYLAERDRLLALEPDVLVLYPEGLGFEQISQKRRWHRWLEGWRRLGLAWRLLWRAELSIVVYRPRQLKKPNHLAIVALAGLAKAVRPWRIKLKRQKTPPANLVAPLLGHTPPPVAPEKVELANIRLAVKQGAKGALRLSPVWLNAAFSRMPESDPLYAEIKTLTEVVAHFGERDLPVLAKPHGYITAAPFKDTPVTPVHGIRLTAFMLHIHQTRRLKQRFPLESAEGAQAYKTWLKDQAPGIFPHAMFREGVEEISSDLTPQSIARALRRIVANARFFGAESGVDPSLKSWLKTPLPNGLTRLAFLLAVLAHAPSKTLHDLQKPWMAQALKPWFAKLAFGSYPALAELAALTPPSQPPTWLTSGNSANDTGLGQNQRMSKQALQGLVPKRNFCLHHVNADAIPAKMLRHHTPGTYHIGFLLWELEAIPEAHMLAGKVLNEVWAPSRYVQKIYQRHYDCPVTWVGKGFNLPPASPFDLAQLGIEQGQPVFLLSFDLHSSVARKNPLAAVLAFQMAFEGNPEARLVIKTSIPPKDHWGDPEQQMSIIKKLMARDKRIILFQAHLGFAEYLGLIKSATALVSPHRAEGFGYVPAYAMALGTPVIATDYAGTQDFCTPETALAVPWRKRNVRPGEPIFPLKNAFWAEINHELLADAMRNVIAAPKATAQRVAAGQALMQNEYSEAALKGRYAERLTALGLI